MKYLILSDIHANAAALEAVLAAAEGRWQRMLVLGDLVGYGAEPNEVVDRVRALDPLEVIRGNHDKACCGLEDASNFNQVARVAATWTSDMLRPENRDYLRELPSGPIAIDDEIEICHGAPYDEDHYIFDVHEARRAIDASTRPLCLFGHTHLPVIFFQTGDRLDGGIPQDEEVAIPIQPGIRYLVNAGSVGQPRDGDPRAAFALFDSDTRTLVLQRVTYPVELAQQKILAAGLPQSLANRLALGR